MTRDGKGSKSRLIKIIRRIKTPMVTTAAQTGHRKIENNLKNDGDTGGNSESGNGGRSRHEYEVKKIRVDRNGQRLLKSQERIRHEPSELR